MTTTTADLDLLSRIGAEYGTDKVSHGFCTFYDHHFRVRRKRIAKVLEMRIFGGSSLYMWRDHFPQRGSSRHGSASRRARLSRSYQHLRR